jgi:hypothetical protein
VFVVVSSCFLVFVNVSWCLLLFLGVCCAHPNSLVEKIL